MRWNQKYSKEKMFSLVAEYLSGGITQKVLCAREGFSKGTFKYWSRKYRLEESRVNKSVKTKRRSKSSDFIAISVPEIIASSSCELALTYPNGVRLELSTVLDTEGLSTLKELVLCLD